MSSTDVRIAENESRFRTANEAIEDRAAELAFHLESDFVPFICECGDPRCTELIRLTLDEYEEVRANPRWFACMPGHERVVEHNGSGRLVQCSTVSAAESRLGRLCRGLAARGSTG